MKKKLALVLSLVLCCAMLSSCTTLTALMGKQMANAATDDTNGDTVTISREEYEKYKQFDKLLELMDIVDEGYFEDYDKQSLLDGAADGSFGDKTETAVKEAQAYYYQLMQATVTPTPAATKAWMTPTPTPTFAPTPELTASPDGTPVAPAATKQPTPTPTIRFAPEPTPYAPDGVASEELLAWLHGGTFDVYQATAQRGDKTAEAMRVQRRLVYLGYMRKADGNFGPATERCLVYFQKLNGLKQTGVADETTQRRLFSESAVKSDIIVTQYRITIDLNKQRVYVYEWNGSNFDNKIKEFKCSTGKDETPTPKGEFWNTAPLTEWWYFKEFDCWAKYAWTIDGGIFFHSEIYSAKDDRTVRSNTIKQLGRKASHGCVRLYRDNAKWIFDNCPAGTPVTVK